MFSISVVRDFELEAHHIHLLTAACEALDRAEQARKTIAKDGPFFRNRHGERKAHPALSVERDNRALYARLIRELNLDVDSPDDPRLPRIGGARN